MHALEAYLNVSEGLEVDHSNREDLKLRVLANGLTKKWHSKLGETISIALAI
jgi:hypothetical protein